MKKKFILYLFILSLFNYSQVGMGTLSPNPNAVLEINSQMNNKGVLVPRLTTTQRDLIVSGVAENGLTIYNVSTSCYNFWEWNANNSTGKWAELCGTKEGSYEIYDCSTLSVTGPYDNDKELSKQTVAIIVPIKVNTLGSYDFSTIINGVTFAAKGIFVNIGIQNVRLVPASGAPVTTGSFKAKITVKNIICDQLNISFVSRATSTLKILNITGAGVDHWDITDANGGDYNPNNPIGWAARWATGNATLTGIPTALSYAGTQRIELISLDPTSAGAVAQLDDYLKEVSIVWVGSTANEKRFNSGIISLLREWGKSGNGYIVAVADQTEEGQVLIGLDIFIENGSTVNGTTTVSNLPNIFQTAGVPYSLTDGLSIPYDGTHAGYMTTSGAISFLKNPAGTRNLGVYQPKTQTFGFGDKFAETITTVASGGFTNAINPGAYNLQRVLVDIWAYMLKNAPVK